jgi:hypothetical protein
MRNSGRLNIAYLTNQYPKVSQSFIHREIEALERRGFEVAPFSVRPPGDLVEAADKEEEVCTGVLLASGWVALGAVVQRPFRLTKALRVATSMARKSDRGFLGHMIDLAEACLLGRRLQEGGWLVPGGSVEALARAIDARLQPGADPLAAMDEAGRQRVADLHAIDRAVEPLSGLFARRRLS